MTTSLYFLDLALKKRVDGNDNDMRLISKENYESSSILDKTYTLTATVNEVINNGAGDFLIVADVSVATAGITLYVDAKQMTFYDFFAGIVSGTVISVTSDTACDIGITLIKIV